MTSITNVVMGRAENASCGSIPIKTSHSRKRFEYCFQLLRLFDPKEVPVDQVPSSCRCRIAVESDLLFGANFLENLTQNRQVLIVEGIVRRKHIEPLQPRPTMLLKVFGVKAKAWVRRPGRPLSARHVAAAIHWPPPNTSLNGAIRIHTSASKQKGIKGGLDE